ncbi:MAG: hypothetical protein A2Y40_04035 [Candidatus Margulisbacteria bacterium GWF2_35_9]|nr:MAG: hypothetical protein A2Y40_04035 [Candidatus Margulisbacteria bacterium GWF2_35_9]
MINCERLVNTFIDLVKIDSESGNEINVRKDLEKRFNDIGLNPFVDKKGNLIGKYINPGSKITILLSAHMDTVKPGIGIVPIINNDVISSKNDTILGADDKSGIAIILETLNIIVENQIEAPSIIIVLSVEEEIGIMGAKEVQDVRADYGFVLDVSGVIGTVVTKAPYHESFFAKITGKAAHAGIEPENGINAIVATSNAISKMEIGRIDFETVSNIGIITGGIATNIVPDTVTVKGEARSHNEQKVTQQMNHIKQIFILETSKVGASVQFESTRDYNSFNLNTNNDIIDICRSAANDIGIELVLEATGGGSDANIFNAFGIPSVVLSTGMAKVHTIQEEIKISDMQKATEFLLAIIKKII